MFMLLMCCFFEVSHLACCSGLDINVIPRLWRRFPRRSWAELWFKPKPKSRAQAERLCHFWFCSCGRAMCWCDCRELYPLWMLFVLYTNCCPYPLPRPKQEALCVHHLYLLAAYLFAVYLFVVGGEMWKRKCLLRISSTWAYRGQSFLTFEFLLSGSTLDWDCFDTTRGGISFPSPLPVIG